MKIKNLFFTAAVISLIIFSLAATTFAADVYSNTELDFYDDENISTDTEIAYRIYYPEGLDFDKEYALLIFLNGAGERGSDGNHLIHESQIRFILNIMNDEELKNEFIVFAPQCPTDMRWVESDWSPGTYDFASTPQSIPAALTMSFIENELLESIKLDRSRIYITGLSMGGFGVYDFLARYPDFFAGAVAVCGGCDVSTAEIIKATPLRIFHSADDTTVSIAGDEAMYAALSELGADVGFTVYEDKGHDSWTSAYSDTETFEWLMSQRKPLPEPEEQQPEPTSSGNNLIYIIIGAAIAVVIIAVILILNKNSKHSPIKK